MLHVILSRRFHSLRCIVNDRNLLTLLVSFTKGRKTFIQREQWRIVQILLPPFLLFSFHVSVMFCFNDCLHSLSYTMFKHYQPFILLTVNTVLSTRWKVRKILEASQYTLEEKFPKLLHVILLQLRKPRPCL